MKKHEIGPSPYTKINSKRIKDPTFKIQNYKTLRRKQGQIFMTLDLAMVSSIAEATIETIDKLNFIKTKNFVHQRTLS